MAHKKQTFYDVVLKVWTERSEAHRICLRAGRNACVQHLRDCDFAVWDAIGERIFSVTICAGSVEAAYALRALWERDEARAR